jgi:hypothetical protein
MPLPSSAQLTRMRTQANAHGATTFVVCTRAETNGPLGQTTATPVEVTSYTGLRYFKNVTQIIAGGGLLQLQEEHITLPATAYRADLTEYVLKDSAVDVYYEITAVNLVDDNILILTDLTVKRVKI